MSIERFHPYFFAVCDYCGARLPAEETFMDAVKSKQGAGWEGRKDGGDWIDVCTDCQAEERGYG